VRVLRLADGGDDRFSPAQRDDDLAVSVGADDARLSGRAEERVERRGGLAELENRGAVRRVA
jgi:hypothetical protein